MPIYLHLISLGVDYHFDVQTRAIDITQVDKQQRMVTKLNYTQNGMELYILLQQSDIVIVTAGSTSSGCYVGADDCPPRLPELDEAQNLDENWSLWLELANKNAHIGNPYNFCTRSRESMLESFTITTEDLEFFDQLSHMSSRGAAGNMISLVKSRWKLNICVPLQPVFTDQSSGQRVLWGYANSPLCEGNYVRKAMVDCTGSEILSELLTHLHIRSQQLIQRTVTIPRVMPRMTTHLLPHSPSDRPNITPRTVANIGIVGQFVDMPCYTSADISYGVRSARIAVSRLMGCSDDNNDVKRDWQMTLSNISKILH
ncbi:hypothetical protein EIK77_006204 [Talaromyces pinophilus]|nr:hypothetical protein EIK77_006204 [Talaromyces pinophilus]